MNRNNARLQMLTLALFAVLAFVSLDLGSVQAVMDDYGLLDGPAGASPEAVAAERPAATPWSAEGPSLAVNGTRPAGDDKAPQPACCSKEIALDRCCEERLVHVTQQLAGIRKGAKVPVFTSMWIDRKKTWLSLDAAAKALGLDDAQRASWERTLEDARYELEGLVRLRDGARIAEAKRIIASYAERLRADLTPEQQAIFDAHAVAPLFQSRAERIDRMIQLMSKA